MNGYRPINFVIQELVPPDIYQAFGDRCWELLDSRAVFTLQTLRDHLGPITINNWHVGGSYKESGLRSFNTKTGAKFSQHRFGRAFDCKIHSVTPKEACEYVLKRPVDFPHLTVIENPAATPSWFHFDCRSHTRQGVWIVNP